MKARKVRVFAEDFKAKDAAKLAALAEEFKPELMETRSVVSTKSLKKATGVKRKSEKNALKRLVRKNLIGKQQQEKANKKNKKGSVQNAPSKQLQEWLQEQKDANVGNGRHNKSSKVRSVLPRKQREKCFMEMMATFQQPLR